MNIDSIEKDGRVPVMVVKVEGEINSASYDELQKNLDALIAGGTRYILLDFSRVTYVSSAGLRVLNATYNKLRSIHPDSNLTGEQVKHGVADGSYKSPHLKILKMSEMVRTAFQMTGYDMFIETFEDEKKAIASF